MTQYADEEDFREGPNYLPQEQIDGTALSRALASLYILGDDMFMRMQAHNLEMVDNFITDIEYKTLRELFEQERTPASAFFLAAQSQMWIFAAYELLRTWQQRSKEIVKWAENGGLQQKLEALRAKNNGPAHFGLENQIGQLESVIADSSLVTRIKNELRHLYIPFKELEFLRVAIAKHEVSGKAKSVALMPGYGRINNWCGSLDYQIENGRYIIGNFNRRHIADSIRSIDCSSAPPSDEDLRSFDDFMSGNGYIDQQTKPF